jgi:hypothetical protein
MVLAGGITYEPSTITAPRILNGQDINVAAAATRAVHDALVAKAGTTFEQLVALRALVGAGAAADRDTAAAPAADEAAVKQALHHLEAAGLIQTNGAG